MKDPELIRRQYNERYRGCSSQWTSEDLQSCERLVSRILSWCRFHKTENVKMLDVGCALGYYTKAFYLKGFEAYGLDYSDVAIERAKNLHPECRFIHADGFNPETGIKYDLIFCKGFSGANTHDLSFVAGWVEKYMKLLKPGGKFIFSYSSDFSGNEKDGETVNWTKQELHDFAVMINSRSYIVKHFHRYYFISQIFSALVGYLRKKKLKRYFYIIFSGE